MLIMEIKKYVAHRKNVSLREIAWHFRMESEALRPMLELLVKKGHIQRLEWSNSCGRTCCSCDPYGCEIYYKHTL